MANFEITKIADRVYSIQDAGRSSFYVVEGSDRAAVIDTGITPGEKIMPVIRQCTQKPTVLAVTHAHRDHMHHMEEFEEVYLCQEELRMPEEILEFCAEGRIEEMRTAKEIRTGSRIDLGDDSLEVCIVPGHTWGSAVFLEKKNNMLFTGDAIGSGSGVWMQVESAVPLDVYEHSLLELLRWLVERGGRMSFWGGHSWQQFTSLQVPGYNPLTLGLLADLAELVGRVVRGEIKGHPSAARSFGMEQTLYAAFGRAELEYRASRIHS